MESNQKLKYSEYLRLVISELKTQEYSKFICTLPCVMLCTEENREHADKLKATIQKKLKTYREKHGHSEEITLSRVFNDYSGIKTRVKWLETLAKYYESKGR